MARKIVLYIFFIIVLFIFSITKYEFIVYLCLYHVQLIECSKNKIVVKMYEFIIWGGGGGRSSLVPCFMPNL